MSNNAPRFFGFLASVACRSARAFWFLIGGGVELSQHQIRLLGIGLQLDGF